MNETSEVPALVATTNRGGRPTKYEPETVSRLLAALADGLNQKQACLACGIAENTLKAWREKYPEFETAMMEARETARRKVLAMIKSIGEETNDWRALDTWLQRSFPADYRRDTGVNVTATANVQQAELVCTEEQRMRLIKLREELQVRPATIPLLEPETQPQAGKIAE